MFVRFWFRVILSEEPPGFRLRRCYAVRLRETRFRSAQNDSGGAKSKSERSEDQTARSDVWDLGRRVKGQKEKKNRPSKDGLLSFVSNL